MMILMKALLRISHRYLDIGNVEMNRYTAIGCSINAAPAAIILMNKAWLLYIYTLFLFSRPTGNISAWFNQITFTVLLYCLSNSIQLYFRNTKGKQCEVGIAIIYHNALRLSLDQDPFPYRYYLEIYFIFFSRIFISHIVVCTLSGHN